MGFLAFLLPVWGFFKSLFTGKDHTGSAVNQKVRWIIVGAVVLVIALIVGLRLSYNAGVRTGNETVRKYVESQNAKTAAKEQTQVKIQTVVQTEYQTKVKWVTKVREVNAVAATSVPELAVNDKQEAFIPMGAINVMNAAALNAAVDPVAAQDTRDSGVTLPALTGIVATNYATSHGKDAAIAAWESWYEKTYKNWVGKDVPAEFRAKGEAK